MGRDWTTVSGTVHAHRNAGSHVTSAVKTKRRHYIHAAEPAEPTPPGVWWRACSRLLRVGDSAVNSRLNHVCETTPIRFALGLCRAGWRRVAIVHGVLVRFAMGRGMRDGGWSCRFVAGSGFEVGILGCVCNSGTGIPGTWVGYHLDRECPIIVLSGAETEPDRRTNAKVDQYIVS